MIKAGYYNSPAFGGIAADFMKACQDYMDDMQRKRDKLQGKTTVEGKTESAENKGASVQDTKTSKTPPKSSEAKAINPENDTKDKEKGANNSENPNAENAVAEKKDTKVIEAKKALIINPVNIDTEKLDIFTAIRHYLTPPLNATGEFFTQFMEAPDDLDIGFKEPDKRALEIEGEVLENHKNLSDGTNHLRNAEWAIEPSLMAGGAYLLAQGLSNNDMAQAILGAALVISPAVLEMFAQKQELKQATVELVQKAQEKGVRTDMILGLARHFVQNNAIYPLCVISDNEVAKIVKGVIGNRISTMNYFGEFEPNKKDD